MVEVLGMDLSSQDIYMTKPITHRHNRIGFIERTLEVGLVWGCLAKEAVAKGEVRQSLVVYVSLLVTPPPANSSARLSRSYFVLP